MFVFQGKDKDKEVGKCCSVWMHFYRGDATKLSLLLLTHQPHPLQLLCILFPWNKYHTFWKLVSKIESCLNIEEALAETVADLRMVHHLTCGV